MQVEIMEHKDGNIQIVQAVDRDSNITITKITSSEELPCEEVTEIFENVVIGKALVSICLTWCHVISINFALSCALGNLSQIFIVNYDSLFS